MVLLLPSLLALLACDTEPLCDGLDPAAGDEVAVQLTELGYSDFHDTGFGDTTLPVITSESDWTEATASWGTDGGLSPDFAAQAVWPHKWIFGGCGEWYEYPAWRWGSTLRVRARYESEDGVCDGAFPQLDLVLIDLDGATDLGWCE